MNRKYKKEELKNEMLPLRIETFTATNEGVKVEYDGWHFEARTPKAVINQVLKYIFVGGEE